MRAAQSCHLDDTAADLKMIADMGLELSVNEIVYTPQLLARGPLSKYARCIQEDAGMP